MTQLEISGVDVLTGTESGSVTVTPSGDVTVTPNGDGSYTVTVKNVKDNITLTAASMLFQTVQDELTTVPAELAEKFQNVDALQSALRTEVKNVNSNVPDDQTALLDIKLQYTTNGTDWVDATPEHFPKGGIQVTIPYSDLGSTDSSYTFTVIHMFTTTMNGHTVGATETITPRRDTSGLHFAVTSLFPFAVGWTKTTAPVVYPVVIEESQHGKVTASPDRAEAGSTVTLTVTPDSGYVLDTLTVTGSEGKKLKLTAQSNGRYTFAMPDSEVTVKAVFTERTQKPCDGGADCPSHGFTDLDVGAWYHEAVDFVLGNHLMNGFGNGLFGPNAQLTRAQLTQILYNREGKPAVTGGSKFTDVDKNAWYSDAVNWAVANGIVGGYGNGKFGPDDNITREQLAVMLWRYAKSPAATNKKLDFKDAGETSNYALDAIRWAVENGIINGKGNGILDPKGQATRAQTAQMLKNFIEVQEDDARKNNEPLMP